MTEGPGYGGIPPDADQPPLMVCCYPGCEHTAAETPLTVTVYRGAMRAFCHPCLIRILAGAGA